jgi:hypothetical protein
VVWFDALEWANHSVSEGDDSSVIMLKELDNDCWSHEPCRGVQDGDTVYGRWAAYIGGGTKMGTNGGMKGEPTMVMLGLLMRVYCCRRWCCSYCNPSPSPPPPQSWIGVHVDGPSPRVVEGRLGARGLAALALVALARSAAATPTTTTALFLTLTTIARGTRLSRRRRSWGVVGVECIRGSHRRVGAERDLI